MKNRKDNDFTDRRSAAADAKAARLEAHRAAREAAEPTRLARQEERMALAAARDEWQAEAAITPPEDHDAFSKLVSPMRNRIIAAGQKARTLTTLCEPFLPRLMSGELRIGEVAAGFEGKAQASHFL